MALWRQPRAASGVVVRKRVYYIGILLWSSDEQRIRMTASFGCMNITRGGRFVPIVIMASEPDPTQQDRQSLAGQFVCGLRRTCVRSS